MEEININGKIYVPKGTQQAKAVSKKGMDYCITRTKFAGVFAGWIDRKVKGTENTIFDSRRIWYWAGASSLSQLANDGTKKPNTCKFAQELAEDDLKDIIEVIPCTRKSQESIQGVKVWEQ